MRLRASGSLSQWPGLRFIRGHPCTFSPPRTRPREVADHVEEHLEDL